LASAIDLVVDDNAADARRGDRACACDSRVQHGLVDHLLLREPRVEERRRCAALLEAADGEREVDVRAGQVELHGARRLLIVDERERIEADAIGAHNDAGIVAIRQLALIVGLVDGETELEGRRAHRVDGK
jgi:hypothetical protein